MKIKAILLSLILLMLGRLCIAQPYLFSDAPPSEDNVTRYYIRCNVKDIEGYCEDYSINYSYDPNNNLGQCLCSDPNFYVKAEPDGSIKLDLSKARTGKSYAISVQACSEKACGCPTFISFVPVKTPACIKGLRISKEECYINRYYYMVIQGSVK